MRSCRNCAVVRGLWTEVGVASPFLTDRGGTAVARQHNRVVRQDQEFGADGRQQLVQVAVGKVQRDRCFPGTARRLRRLPRERPLSTGNTTCPWNVPERRAPCNSRPAAEYVSPSSTRSSAGGLVIPAPYWADRLACASVSLWALRPCRSRWDTRASTASSPDFPQCDRRDRAY